MLVRLPARRRVGFFAQLCVCVCVCVCFSAGSRLSQGQEQLRLVFVPLKDKGTLCC